MSALLETKDQLSPDTDDVYTALMVAHEGLSEAESHALNARLVLLLANEVGNSTRLKTLFEEARAVRERRKGEAQGEAEEETDE
ncbi:MAG: DUF2783 domain-containing protein [Pseudomonadota bacterium]